MKMLPTYNMLFNLGYRNPYSSQAAGVLQTPQNPQERMGMVTRATKPQGSEVQSFWPGAKAYGWRKA